MPRNRFTKKGSGPHREGGNPSNLISITDAKHDILSVTNPRDHVVHSTEYRSVISIFFKFIWFTAQIWTWLLNFFWVTPEKKKQLRIYLYSLHIYLIVSRSYLFASISNWMRANMKFVIYLPYTKMQIRQKLVSSLSLYVFVYHVWRESEVHQWLRQSADFLIQIFRGFCTRFSSLHRFGRLLLRSFLIIPTFLNKSKRVFCQPHAQNLFFRRLQRDVVYICWAISPSKCGGRRGVAGSQPMSTAVHITWHGAQINFGDPPPYLIYAIFLYLGSICRQGGGAEKWCRVLL